MVCRLASPCGRGLSWRLKVDKVHRFLKSQQQRSKLKVWSDRNTLNNSNTWLTAKSSQHWWRCKVISLLVTIDQVTLYWARLLLGWVTVCRYVNHLGM